MRSASLCAYSEERLFLIEQCRSVCGRSGIAFSRVGSQRQTAVAAPLSAKARRCGKACIGFQRAEPSQLRCAQQLPRRGSFIRTDRKIPKSSPFGGAGCDQREQTERVCSPFGRAGKSAGFDGEGEAACGRALVPLCGSSRESVVPESPQTFRNHEIKIILPLKMARAAAEAILNGPLPLTSPPICTIILQK